ncbi:MAG TPA: BLUF domain-containing protein [Sphingomonas sp.]|jgi:hypothetical protein
MRQVLYTSTSALPPGQADLEGILDASRHNNAIDGITGLLWSDGTRFIQAIEGPRDSIDQTFNRISDDPRHVDVQVLSDRPIAKREFGSWTMELRPIDARADAYDARIQRLLIAAPEPIREQFRDVVSAG